MFSCRLLNRISVNSQEKSKEEKGWVGGECHGSLMSNNGRIWKKQETQCTAQEVEKNAQTWSQTSINEWHKKKKRTLYTWNQIYEESVKNLDLSRFFFIFKKMQMYNMKIPENFHFMHNFYSIWLIGIESLWSAFNYYWKNEYIRLFN